MARSVPLARRHRWHGLAIALLLVVVSALVPSSANAATYVIRQCNDGAGRGLPITPDFVEIWEDRPTSNTCESGGNLAFTLSPNALSPYGAEASRRMGFSFVLPAALPNAKFTKAVATLWVPPATSDPNLSDMQMAMHGQDFVAEYDRLHNFSSWGGLPHVARGGELPVASRFVRFLVYCWAPCDFRSGPTMALDSATLTIDDPLPPAAPNVEPSGLLDGTVQQGTRPLRFGVADADSGIRRIELRTASGTQLGATPDAQNCSYTRPIPGPQERPQEQFAVDTSRLPDGRHTLELWVTDAAGNQRKSAVAPITVQNAPPPVVTPTPVPGAPTSVPVSPVGTASPTPAASTTPQPTALLPTPIPADTPGAVETTISFAVSHKTPRRGSRVVFSGAVAPVPAVAGRVIIEAKAGKRWITAAVVRTRDGGAFRWSHIFSRRGAFTMRARLLSSVEAKTRPAVSPRRSFRVR